MAGGGQSPRQKMINLMYLVFIAMIAMNVDKEILNAFKIFDVKFTSSNARLEQDNQLAMAGLEEKATEQPAKYQPLLGKAKEVKEISKVIDSLHKTPKYAQDGYPMVRVTDIESGPINLKNTLKFLSKSFQ